MPIMTTEVTKVIVDWKTGHISDALERAIQIAEQASLYPLLFGYFLKKKIIIFIYSILSNLLSYRTKFELENLLILSVFLFEQRQYELANKIHNIAKTLHSAIFDSCSLSKCFPMYLSFICDCISFSPNFPDQSLHEPSKLSSTVSKLFSLMANFIPSGQEKSIISPHGLYVAYKTLSSICAPYPSPYSLHPLACPSSSPNSSPSPSLSSSTPSPPSSSFSSPCLSSSSSCLSSPSLNHSDNSTANASSDSPYSSPSPPSPSHYLSSYLQDSPSLSSIPSTLEKPSSDQSTVPAIFSVAAGNELINNTPFMFFV